MKQSFLLINILFFSSTAFALTDNYYAAVKLAYSSQKANNMDTSLRPGIGQFIEGEDKKDKITPVLALGYDYKNNWRTEAEFSFEKAYEYTSGSTNFPTSFNHHKVKTQSLFLNAYRDFDVYRNVSLFGSLGIGVAKIKSSGWQGVENRLYSSNTDTQLAYSVGAGLQDEQMKAHLEKNEFYLGIRYGF